MSKQASAGRWSGTWSGSERRFWRRGFEREKTNEVGLDRPWIWGQVAVASGIACRWTSRRTFQTLELRTRARHHARAVRMVQHVERGKTDSRARSPSAARRPYDGSETSDRYLDLSMFSVFLLHGTRPMVARMASSHPMSSFPALCFLQARREHRFFRFVASTNHRTARCVT